MYLDNNGGLVIPAENLFSMMAAENTKSAAKVFYGKKWRDIAHGVNTFTSIPEATIPLRDDTGEQIKWGGEWTDQISLHKSVARLAKGIPNPKERPCVALPWHMEFEISLTDNDKFSSEALKNLLDLCGQLGIGTYRPIFGQFVLDDWQKLN